jgi:ATP-dependent Clp protease ATP-binding subunit ClpC
MVLSQEEARKLGQMYVGSEHLLLGLIREEDGIAAQALRRLDVNYEETLEQVKRVAEKPGEPAPAGHIPFTPRAKRVLEGALREMLSLGQSYIATEHLLLGILREGNGVAMEALSRMGVSADAVRNAISELAPKRSTPPLAGVASGVGPGGNPFAGPDPDAGGSALRDYGRDLTQLAADGKLDPVVGREAETERVMEVLARRTKNNPLLIGDPGVGKTAVVEGLAQRIVSGDVPEMLAGRHVWTLDVAALVAGAKYRGEFEDRLKRVVAEVIEDPTLILFVDELHTLVGAGSAEGSLDAAAILKPPLSRGEIQIIGATTTDEYRKYLQKDSAFARRFQPIQVDEPTPAQSLQILEGLRGRYEEHHHVHYSDEAIAAAVSLADRYIQDRFLPDKAIDLLDEAGASVRVHAVARPEALKECAQRLSDVRAEREQAAAGQDYERAASLRDEEKRLSDQVAELEGAWHEQGGSVTGDVTPETIANVVSRATGVPVTNLTEAETDKLLRMESVLHERIVAQDEAVTKVSKAIRRSRAGLRDPRRPSGSFIFLGPSGTGKTELSKALAEFLFGTQDALISFDMSEYMEKHAVSKLVGAPPGYVGYDEGGELTKAVRQKPYSVVLFDEIEKAHPDIFNILLQILEEGRLTDGQGRKVDFSNTVIIMTSNVGASEIAKTTKLGFAVERAGGGLDDKAVHASVMSEVKKLFKPEFLNRVDDIVVFNSLTDEQLLSIVDLLVEDLRDRLVERGMNIVLTKEAKAVIAKEGSDATYGARPLRRAIQSLVEDPLSEKILEGALRDGTVVTVDAQDGKLTFTWAAGEIPAPRRRETLGDERYARPARGRVSAPSAPAVLGSSASD